MRRSRSNFDDIEIETENQTANENRVFMHKKFLHIFFSMQIFMHKIFCFNTPSIVPPAVRGTIPPNVPRHGSDHVSCQQWLAEYGSTHYRTSIFFKGPVLCNDQKYTDLCTPPALLSVKVFKNNVKRMLLDLQELGDKDEWQPENFWLYSIKGLRSSDRLNNN